MSLLALGIKGTAISEAGGCPVYGAVLCSGRLVLSVSDAQRLPREGLNKRKGQPSYGAGGCPF